MNFVVCLAIESEFNYPRYRVAFCDHTFSNLLCAVLLCVLMKQQQQAPWTVAPCRVVYHIATCPSNGHRKVMAGFDTFVVVSYLCLVERKGACYKL